MPDDLYHHDILAWSATQAERLRRVAAGERVNDVDWGHVIEEIEELGKSELRTVRSLFRLALIHALKLAGWPDHPAADHWTGELTNFLVRARDRFEPGMAQHLDMAELHAGAVAAVEGMGLAGQAHPLPAGPVCTLPELTDPRFGAAALVARLREAARQA